MILLSLTETKTRSIRLFQCFEVTSNLLKIWLKWTDIDTVHTISLISSVFYSLKNLKRTLKKKTDTPQIETKIMVIPSKILVACLKIIIAWPTEFPWHWLETTRLLITGVRWHLIEKKQRNKNSQTSLSLKLIPKQNTGCCDINML